MYKESRTTLSSLPETLQTTTLPSSPLLIHGYNGYLLAHFRIFFCVRHTLRMHIPSLAEECHANFEQPSLSVMPEKLRTVKTALNLLCIIRKYRGYCNSLWKLNGCRV